MKLFHKCIFLFLFHFITTNTPIKENTLQNIPSQCLEKCIKPYGQLIGTFNGIASYSNCNNDCISEESNTIILNNKEIISGMKWQCVEFVRRYLIINKQVIFGDIESAYMIFDIKNVTSAFNDTIIYDFTSLENKNTEVPKIDDLIIYPISKDAPFGHVAVISDINIEQGYYTVAEQNYFNNDWVDKNYSRRLKLIKCEREYIATDTIYEDKEYDCESHVKEVIGWKRVKAENYTE